MMLSLHTIHHGSFFFSLIQRESNKRSLSNAASNHKPPAGQSTMLLALVAASNISLSLALLVGNHRAVVVAPRWGVAGGAASSSGIVPAAATFASPSSVARRTAFATAGLVTLDVGFRSLFAKYSIPFPSSLAGCGALFAAMVSLNAIAVAGDDDDDDNDHDHDEKKRMGEGLYLALNPGATLLAKWLPVFFVPSLITLPLASGLGNAREVRPPRFVS